MARRTKKPSLNVILDRLTYTSNDGPSIGRLPYHLLADYTLRILEAANINDPNTREAKRLRFEFEDILEEILEPDEGIETLNNYPRPPVDTRRPLFRRMAEVIPFPTRERD